MTVVLFGSNNPSGAYFLKSFSSQISLETWGRRPSVHQNVNHFYCDIEDSDFSEIKPLKGVLVSFAPIWLLAKFLERIAKKKPQALSDLIGVVACSSSSYVTKRYSFNRKDQLLATSLAEAHSVLSSTCLSIGVYCQILAPTLVYGYIDGFSDKNMSTLIRMMRIFPIIGLPRSSGLRQPIHASQLASVARSKADKMLSRNWDGDEALVLSLGGDEILSYVDMLTRIQKNASVGDSAKRCKIIVVPDKLFYCLAAPILPLNVSIFESIMRINSNLSGFTKTCTILNTSCQGFPILPLPF